MAGDVLKTTGLGADVLNSEVMRFKLKPTDATGAELVEDIWKYYETRMVQAVAYQIMNDESMSDEDRKLAKKFLVGLTPTSAARTFDVPIDNNGNTIAVQSLNPNGLLRYCVDFNSKNYPTDYDEEKLGEELARHTFNREFSIDLTDIPLTESELLSALDRCDEAFGMVNEVFSNCYNFVVEQNELNRSQIRALLALRDACQEKYHLADRNDPNVGPDDVFANVLVGDLAYHTPTNKKQAFYELEQVIEANVEADTLVDELKHHITFDGMSPFEAYLMVYDFVTQKAYREDEKHIDERSYVGTLSTDARVCAGYALLLTKMCNSLNLGDLLKVEMIGGHGVNPHLPGHSFCKVTIDDEKYKIKGEYAADPTLDAVISPQDDEERKILGHVLSFSKKASEDCDDEDGKRLAGSKVLNALIPPQLIPDYGVGRFFNPESNTYETNDNVRTRFPASAPVVSLASYRDGLKRGFMYRFNHTHSTRQINSMVEEKLTNSRLSAWAGGMCFGKDYDRWYNRVNLFRPERYKMGVANTSLARATKLYVRKLRLDKVHVFLRSVLTTIVEGAIGLVSNVHRGVSSRRAARAAARASAAAGGTSPTGPAPTHTP